MRESAIEKALVKEAKSRGGMAVKFVSPGFDGVPDRLVLLPGGKCAFVELKASGKVGKVLVMEGRTGKMGSLKRVVGVSGSRF